MGNTQGSRDIIGRARTAALELAEAPLDEGAIHRAEIEYTHILDTIALADFAADRLANVTKASNEFLAAINQARARLEAHRARQTALSEQRKAKQREDALKTGADPQARLEQVERSLAEVVGKLKALERTWEAELKPAEKNQFGVPIEAAADAFYDRSDVKELWGQRRALNELKARLEGLKGRNQEEQLGSLGAQMFVDAFARAQGGQDPFPVEIPDRLRSALDRLREDLKGLDEGSWERSLGELLKAGLAVDAILRAPLPDTDIQNALDQHKFAEREGGIFPEDQALEEAEKAFADGPLRAEVLQMIRAMKGGAGHGARLRSRAPRLVLYANRAGFNLQVPAVFDFINTVGISWISAVSDSDSGGPNPTKIRGEI